MDQNRTPDSSPEREPDQGGSQPRPARPGRLDRSGQDSRKRGWFWHWNEIITQYAPLIGLKGVGLLNSYTTWTDRRDNSPHRGYAFPSQKAEAAFYGEDRAELITINKILTALDLVEIRKEMVTKPDEKGRQWKVPHNFYRVKDRQDGLTLTTEDVIRVVELADRDAAVYRYVRRIFSQRFEPIDRHNVWHTILEEIADHPTWKRLCEKTAKQESRASARTRAGHRTRSKATPAGTKPAGAGAPGESRDGAKMTSGQFNQESLDKDKRRKGEEANGQTPVAATNTDPDTTNAPVNTGSEVDVEPGNTGSGRIGATDDDTANTGPSSSVEPTNTMYHQSPTTTTTTTTRVEQNHEGSEIAADPEASPDDTPHPDEGDPEQPLPASGHSGSGERPSPDRGGEAQAGRGADHPGGWGPLGDPSALVVSLFEAANDRKATRLERVLLSELERDATRAAERTGETGAEWVAAALREAVASGSAFVAPKRIREIINRWAEEGRGERSADALSQLAAAPPQKLSSGIWRDVKRKLKRELGESAFDRLLMSSECVSDHGDGLVVRVQGESVAEKLDREYRPLIERVVERVAGRPLAISFVAGEEQQPEGVAGVPGIEIAREDLVQGRQLWEVILGDLAAHIGGAERRRLAGVVVLGEDPEGNILLGADRRSSVPVLQERFAEDIQAALARFMGRSISGVRALHPEEWTVRDEGE
ncbi:MAG: hypothetical protein ACOC9Y_02000 [Chloroflexota bacterium]